MNIHQSEIGRREIWKFIIIKQNNLEYNHRINMFQMNKFNTHTTTVFDEEKRIFD